MTMASVSVFVLETFRTLCGLSLALLPSSFRHCVEPRRIVDSTGASDPLTVDSD